MATGHGRAELPAIGGRAGGTATSACSHRDVFAAIDEGCLACVDSYIETIGETQILKRRDIRGCSCLDRILSHLGNVSNGVIIMERFLQLGAPIPVRFPNPASERELVNSYVPMYVRQMRYLCLGDGPIRRHFLRPIRDKQYIWLLGL